MIIHKMVKSKDSYYKIKTQKMSSYHMVPVWLLTSVCTAINALLLSHEMFSAKGINTLSCLISHGALSLF
jgi:tellurite resistance protein TehA-like permease